MPTPAGGGPGTPGGGNRRVARTMPATLEHTFVLDETGADAASGVTVTVTDANGAEVASGPATPQGDGRYTYVLPGQPQVAELTVSWAGTIAGAAVVESETVDVVGARYFTLAQGRASDADLADEARYTTADLKIARDETEGEYEEITLRPYVARYRRAVLSGTGGWDLTLPDPAVRTIRAASIAPRLDETFTALSGGELAALAVLPDGMLRRTDGQTWTYGTSNVVVEYEYCEPGGPPPDLIRAMLTRFRSRLNLNKSGIPDRASSYQSADGGVYRLSMPDEYATGIPDVDAVYSRYSRRRRGRKARPASRTLSYNPQAGSLFHGRGY